MKIRSISYFLNPEWPLNQQKVSQAGVFLQKAQPAYEAAGYEVQTARLVTIPFPELFAGRIQAVYFAMPTPTYVSLAIGG